MDEPTLDFETIAARAGLYMRVGDTVSTVGPIDASTTFTHESVDGVHDALASEGHGFAYSRNANPTVAAFEESIARLEHAGDAVAFGSGMAAVHAALIGTGLQAGDTVVAATDLYGVTRNLLTQLANFDVVTEYVDVFDHAAVEAAIQRAGTRVLYFETISNPLLRVADAEVLIEIGHRFRKTVIVDNTFATPYLFRPVSAGADIVVHSATKYISGHGDVTAGLVVTRRNGSQVRAVRSSMGGVLSPFEAWLAMRGLRTLAVRMDRQSETALSIARWLTAQPWVNRVYYPGLINHPQHEVARRQFGGKFSGMVAFDLHGGRQEAIRFMDALQLVGAATSLGDVASLALYPPLSSHRALSPEQLRGLGIGEGLVRLSVGLESLRDLTHDLAGAASRVGLPLGTHAVR